MTSVNDSLSSRFEISTQRRVYKYYNNYDYNSTVVIRNYYILIINNMIVGKSLFYITINRDRLK